jgi:hypothetical protein
VPTTTPKRAQQDASQPACGQRGAPVRGHACRLLLTGWASAALTLGACNQQDHADRLRASLPDGETYESEHFVYHLRNSDDSACPAITQTLERHFHAMQQALGFAWPKDAQVHYFKFANQNDLRRQGHCSPQNRACFFADVGVESFEAMNTHELIHAYLSPIGERHRALEEGLSEALSCDGLVRHPYTALPLEEVFNSEAWGSTADPLALSRLYSATLLVGYVLNTLPSQRFLDWYRQMSPKLNSKDAERLFQDVFKRSLAELWGAAQTDGRSDIACAPIWECSAPDLKAHPLSRWRSSCAMDDRARSLEFPTAHWVTQESPQGGARFGSCAALALPQDAFLGLDDAGQAVPQLLTLVPAGRYFYSVLRGGAEENPDASTLQASPFRVDADDSGSPGDGSRCEQPIAAPLEPISAELGPHSVLGIAPGTWGPASSPGPSLTRWFVTSPKGQASDGAVAGEAPDAGSRADTVTILCSAGFDLAGCGGCNLDDCLSFCGKRWRTDELDVPWRLQFNPETAGWIELRVAGSR